MLVEDDTVNQIVMEAVLRDLGVQVLMADSGEQALDLLEQEAVDLVLMDCHMPGMDGLTTTRHWRGKEARLQRRRVPVIGLTGDVYTGAREACLEAGMDDYLTKPASRADIGAVLARWALNAPQGKTGGSGSRAVVGWTPRPAFGLGRCAPPGSPTDGSRCFNAPCDAWQRAAATPTAAAARTKARARQPPAPE